MSDLIMNFNVPFSEILDPFICRSIDTAFKTKIIKSNFDYLESPQKLYKAITNNIKFLLKEINKFQAGNEEKLTYSLQKYFLNHYEYPYIEADLKYTNNNLIVKPDTTDNKLKFVNNTAIEIKPFLRDDAYVMIDDKKCLLNELPCDKLKSILNQSNNDITILYSNDDEHKYPLNKKTHEFITAHKIYSFNSFGASIHDTYKMLDDIDLTDIFSPRDEKKYIDLNKALLNSTILLFWILDEKHIKKVLADNLIFPSATKTNKQSYIITGENIMYTFFGMTKVIWHDLQSFYNKGISCIDDIVSYNINNLDTIIHAMKYSHDIYTYSKNKIKSEYDKEVTMYDIYENSDDIEYVSNLFKYVTSLDTYFLDNSYKSFISEIHRRKHSSIESYNEDNFVGIKPHNESLASHDIYNGYRMNYNFSTTKKTYQVDDVYENVIDNNEKYMKYKNDILILNYDTVSDLNNLNINQVADKLIYYNNLMKKSDDQFKRLYSNDVDKVTSILQKIIEKYA